MTKKEGLLSRHHAVSAFSWLAGVLLLVADPMRSQAELQFDMFVGYGEVVREAAWFPISFELHNDGPSFDGMIEVNSGQFGGQQRRRIAVELPTGTRKRVSIPAFASGGRNTSWDARLVDSRGKVRAERIGVRPTDAAWETVLVGAISRSEAGLPSFPPIKIRRDELQPKVTRIPLELAPENPIAFEGLSAVYLNSSRAIDLRAPQVAALLAWLENGGHLIFSVEQPGDIQATPWMRQLAPIDVTSLSNRRVGAGIQAWLNRPLTALGPGESGFNRSPNPAPRRQLRPTTTVTETDPYVGLMNDSGFDLGEIPVATGAMRDGTVMLSMDGVPAVVRAPRGRGMITLLTFNPEREPFRSWKNRNWFWARLLDVPAHLYLSSDFNAYGGWSADAIFGSMLDSRQIRKLPVEWLLGLLIIYLIVIGPFDQWWLKKINRQMLTWITFPSYVLIFSLLIYFIGFKLRHGEAEWNELHLVDVVTRPGNAKSAWRGRSYYSVYSPVNARYEVASEQPYATLRGEFLGQGRGGSQESGGTVFMQRPSGFDASLDIPVWTSQLFAGDWQQPGDPTLEARVSPRGNDLEIALRNRGPRGLSQIRLAYQDRMYELGSLPAQQATNVTLARVKGKILYDYLAPKADQFKQLASRRQQTFGNNEQPRWDDLPSGATVASFIGILDRRAIGRSFVHPPGLDLTPVLDRGGAVVLAWDAGESLVKPVNKFKVSRGQRNTMLRLAVWPETPIAAR